VRVEGRSAGARGGQELEVVGLRWELLVVQHLTDGDAELIEALLEEVDVSELVNMHRAFQDSAERHYIETERGSLAQISKAASYSGD
jgi:hypothetical protein